MSLSDAGNAWDKETARQQEAVEAALEADREKSLRDVFAASALGAIIAAEGSFVDKDWQAARAYHYADAMLRARKQS